MKNYTTEQLQLAYANAKELTYEIRKNGVTFIGVLFEPFHDISLYQDNRGNYYYTCYHVDD